MPIHGAISVDFNGEEEDCAEFRLPNWNPKLSRMLWASVNMVIAGAAFDIPAIEDWAFGCIGWGCAEQGAV